jgi:predicted molibdopterin-dependent oxidoreductase YjgC
VLINAMAKALIDRNLMDQTFISGKTEGFEALKASLASYDINSTEAITGVSREKIALAVKTYGSTKPASIIYNTAISLNGDGASLTQALANLAALTGNLGVAGAGVNPLRGENNSQGAADMGISPEFLPGYSAAQRKGVRASEMLQSRAVKALMVFGDATNIPTSQFNDSFAGLDSLDFLVVADISMTEMAKKADVVLPLTTWAEKSGTFTSAERRVQVVQKAVPAQGLSKNGLEIISLIASALGEGAQFKTSVKDVQSEIVASVPLYADLGLTSLTAQGAQWPSKAAVLPVGRVIFSAAPAVTPSQPSVSSNSLTVLNYLLREIEGVVTLNGKPAAELNDEDAAGIRLADGDVIEIETALGRSSAVVKLSKSAPRGYMYLAHPWTQTMDALLHRLLPTEQARLSHTKVASVKVRKLEAIAAVR